VHALERALHEAFTASGRQSRHTFLRLREVFRTGTKPDIHQKVVVISTGTERVGLVVDQIIGDHQTVIKNLGRLYRNVQMVSGATILGNGTVALILDPHRLVQDAVHSRWSGSRCEESRARQTNGLERQEFGHL